MIVYFLNKLDGVTKKKLTLDNENYVHWKLDIGHLSLDFEDTGHWPGLGKLVSPLEARMDHAPVADAQKPPW